MAKKKLNQKSESLRQRAAKAAAAKPRRRRMNSAASAAAGGASRFKSFLTRDYHLINPKESGIFGFLTKSRRLIPPYFRNSASELKFVSWPNRRTSWKLVFAVFGFAVVFGLGIAVIDYVLELIFKRIIL